MVRQTQQLRHRKIEVIMTGKGKDLMFNVQMCKCADADLMVKITSKGFTF